MTEKQYNLRAGYYDEYTGICGSNDENFTTNEVVDLLNEQNKIIKELEKENKELRQDNDIKFWKLQCMHYFNSNSLFMSEISRAIKKGYEVSEQFQKYLDELKENNKEIKEKNKRLFGDSE